MDKQAKEAKEQMKKLSFKDKWTNFWYYYRLHVIVIAIAALLIGYTAVECARKNDYDLQISYYSSSPISDEATDKLVEVLQKNVDDINANGNTDVFIAPCFANPEEMGQQTQAVLLKLSAEIAADETMVYLVDEVYYKRLSHESYEGCFESFEDISEVPEIKEMFGLEDGEKLYLGIRTLKEKYNEDEKMILAHKNAQKALEYIKGLK